MHTFDYTLNVAVSGLPLAPKLFTGVTVNSSEKSRALLSDTTAGTVTLGESLLDP